ncbi:MAG TPA: PilZ domain-containing protein [Gemmataceae bacterium]|jgi:hypothetical protein
MFDELNEADEQRTAALTAFERRTAVRHCCPLEVACRLTGAPREESWMARVRDLSELGIGLVLAYPLGPGMALTLEVPFPGEEEPRLLGVCVVHSTPREEGGFAVGCVFEDRLRRKDLRALLDVNLLEV